MIIIVNASGITMHGRIQTGGTGGLDTPPPLKNHKNIGFPNNIDPDPLKITKLPSQHSMVGHYQLSMHLILLINVKMSKLSALTFLKK